MTKARRILLLEDDDVGVLLTHVLSGEGYLVDLATTNAEAWQLLDAHEYALVIADWKLPDGNGMVIADAAAQLGAKTVVMSGYLFQMPGGRADAHETLMKPVRPSELIDVVQRSIGTRSPSDCRPQPE
jgi:DNA-binding response OmpR family regulator